MTCTVCWEEAVGSKFPACSSVIGCCGIVVAMVVRLEVAARGLVKTMLVKFPLCVDWEGDFVKP